MAQKNQPARDPFYVVRDEVELGYVKLTADFQRWQQDLVQTPFSSPDDTSSVERSLQSAITFLQTKVNDLKKANGIVEINRSKFGGIDNDELATRVNFCNETEAHLKKMEEALRAPRQPAKKPEKKTREELFESKTAVAAGNKHHMLESRERQVQEEIKEQDKILGSMGDVIEQLKNVAETANEALKDQNRNIKVLGGNVDSARENMDVVLAKVDTLLGSSDKGKLLCIVFLVFICALLLILIVYT